MLFTASTNAVYVFLINNHISSQCSDEISNIYIELFTPGTQINTPVPRFKNPGPNSIQLLTIIE